MKSTAGAFAFCAKNWPSITSMMRYTYEKKMPASR